MSTNRQPADSSPLLVYVDLSRQEKFHRQEWELLLGAGNSAGLRLVSEEKDAECSLVPASPWQFGPGKSVFGYSSPPADSVRRFVWDCGDRPTGYEPGLYCSLPRLLFDNRRHRSFCYPINYNEQVSANDFCDASLLFGFVGANSSGLRARMTRNLLLHGRADEMLVTVQGGPWDAMLDRSGLAIKKQYADALRRCRFFLCPRGNGVGSVRLFETMKAARVPVIISDEYVLPTGIDWDGCSIRIAEKDIADLPRILRERDGDWARLATNAQRNWEDNFSDGRLLDRIAFHLRELMALPCPLSLLGRARVLGHPAYSKMRSGLTRLRQTIRS
jgi:hypothetical protein